MNLVIPAEDYEALKVELDEAFVEIERLRAVLEEFARQKTDDEMSEEEYDMADIWGAYEMLIRRARAALSK
jgi:hypothetical protein